MIKWQRGGLSTLSLWLVMPWWTLNYPNVLAWSQLSNTYSSNFRGRIFSWISWLGIQSRKFFSHNFTTVCNGRGFTRRDHEIFITKISIRVIFNFFPTLLLNHENLELYSSLHNQGCTINTSFGLRQQQSCWYDTVTQVSVHLVPLMYLQVIPASIEQLPALTRRCCCQCYPHTLAYTDKCLIIIHRPHTTTSTCMATAAATCTVTE